MLGTAPLGGWKVPYDGPVDTNFTISVDRRGYMVQVAAHPIACFTVKNHSCRSSFPTAEPFTLSLMCRRASDEERRVKKEAQP